jgi:hypothetical protein
LIAFQVLSVSEVMDQGSIIQVWAHVATTTWVKVMVEVMAV